MPLYLIAGLLLVGSIANAQQTVVEQTAVKQFARLQHAAEAAHDSGDLRGRVAGRAPDG